MTISEEHNEPSPVTVEWVRKRAGGAQRDTPLLPAGTGTSTTKLLRLHPSRICNQQCTVVCNQLFLQLHGAVGIDVLGVVCNDGLGDSLADSIHL